MNLDRVLEVCKPLARQAGEAILRIYQTDFGVDYKEDASPLTQADLQANEIICRGLEEAFPEAAILSEERADDLSRRENWWCFIVDPLDGTKQFIRKNGQFTVNIALAKDGLVVAGVVYQPVAGDLYYAAKGKGSWREKPGQPPERLSVTHKITDLTIAISSLHRTGEEEALLEAHRDVIGRTVSFGSSLKGCMVAAGEADIYYRYGPTSEWDTAAMQCVIEEAGGVFRQMDGSLMTYNRENTRNDLGFFAVNREENIWI